MRGDLRLHRIPDGVDQQLQLRRVTVAVVRTCERVDDRGRHAVAVLIRGEPAQHRLRAGRRDGPAEQRLHRRERGREPRDDTGDIQAFCDELGRLDAAVLDELGPVALGSFPHGVGDQRRCGRMRLEHDAPRMPRRRPIDHVALHRDLLRGRYEAEGGQVLSEHQRGRCAVGERVELRVCCSGLQQHLAERGRGHRHPLCTTGAATRPSLRHETWHARLGLARRSRPRRTEHERLDAGYDVGVHDAADPFDDGARQLHAHRRIRHQSVADDSDARIGEQREQGARGGDLRTLHEQFQIVVEVPGARQEAVQDRKISCDRMPGARMPRRQDLVERLDAVEARAQRPQVRLLVDREARLGYPRGVHGYEHALLPRFDDPLVECGCRRRESVRAVQDEELGHLACPASRRVRASTRRLDPSRRSSACATSAGWRVVSRSRMLPRISRRSDGAIRRDRTM